MLGIMRHFPLSEAGAGSLGGCCCCSFHLSVVDSQFPSHLSAEAAKQGRSLVLKASPVPNALMTLDRPQIPAISKQNPDAPIPGLPGNTPSLPQSLLSWSSLIAHHPQLSKSPALQPLPPQNFVSFQPTLQNNRFCRFFSLCRLVCLLYNFT